MVSFKLSKGDIISSFRRSSTSTVEHPPVADQNRVVAMALRTRKSMLGDLRKIFNNEKEPDVPAMPHQDPVDVPIIVLRISRYGLVQDQQLTFYRRGDKKFLIDDIYYYVPRCMQPPGTIDLDPAIRRFTWVFKKEFASKSTAAKQESFMGAYSIWYKDTGTPACPKTLSQIDGDFWMMKQLQNEPIRGDTIEWRHIPKGMLNELNNNWWFMGVQLPDIDAVSKRGAADWRECRF